MKRALFNRRRRNGAQSFDPAVVMADWWDADRSYTGPPTGVTGLPSLGAGGNALTYASSGALAAITTLGTKSVVNFGGGNTNARFFSDAVGAQVGAGSSTPWTIAMSFRLSNISGTRYAFGLNDGTPANNNHVLKMVSAGNISPSMRDSTGVIDAPVSTLVNAVGVTQSIVIRRNANSTVDIWNDGVHTDVAVPWGLGNFNAMTSFTIGCFRTDSSNYIGELSGVLGAWGFDATALSDSDCGSISSYLKEWGN